MKQVFADLEQRTRAFSKLKLFQMLESDGIRSDVELTARGVSFFALSFQDMLRLNALQITDPELRKLARQQRKDDAGHDRWFLEDVRTLRIEPDVGWLFGKQHQQTRDTSYEILAQILVPRSDHARLTVGLALEATGGVFISRVYGFFARLGLSAGLKFFAESHWQVEQSHECLDAELQQRLSDSALPESARQDALRASEATFRAVTLMCDAISDQMLEARSRQGFTAA